MGFVDRYETDAHVAELRLEKFRRKSLGRDIENADIAEDAVLQGDDNLLVGEP